MGYHLPGSPVTQAAFSEGRIARQEMVLTDANHLGRLRVETYERSDGSAEYALESPMILSREAIARVLAEPLEDDPTIAATHKGLREIAHPSRRVEQASRKIAPYTHWRAVKPDATTLARTMEQYTSVHATIPVFSAVESHTYAAGRLRDLAPQQVRQIIEQLFDITIDAKLMRQWQRKEWRRSPEQKQEVLALLRESLHSQRPIALEASGITTADILSCLMSGEIVELDHRVHEELFRRFTIDEAHAKAPYDGAEPDTDLYVRDDDIPPGVSAGDKTVRAIVGGGLGNNKEHLPRHRVIFRKDAQAHEIHPVLRWRRDGNERSLLFGPGMLDYRNGWDGAMPDAEKRSVYYSPILGAALLAGQYGDDIDYNKALRRYFKYNQQHLQKGTDGLLPLALSYQQNTLLDNAYIRAVEREMEQ